MIEKRDENVSWQLQYQNGHTTRLLKINSKLTRFQNLNDSPRKNVRTNVVSEVSVPHQAPINKTTSIIVFSPSIKLLGNHSPDQKLDTQLMTYHLSQ